MTGNTDDHGFPSGYFVIRSVGSNRLADLEANGGDGTEIILYPEKEKSLVVGFRDPGADNQVFFIDPSGALCSRSSGHAIDVEGDRLILRHRRPVGSLNPYPSKFSHPFPKFRYSQETEEITVHFDYDPTYPKSGEPKSEAWKTKTYVLTSIPVRKPRTVLDDTSEFINANILGPIGGVFGAFKGPQATAHQVLKSNLELNDDEVVEEERREEDEVDDSPDPIRKIRVLGITGKDESDKILGSRARERRKWVVVPLRKSNAKTAGV